MHTLHQLRWLPSTSRTRIHPFATAVLAALLTALPAGLSAAAEAVPAEAGPGQSIDRAALEAFVAAREATREAELRATASRAAALGLPLRLELPGGNGAALAGFDAAGRPLYLAGANLDAARTISTDDVWPGGGAGLDLDGAGQLMGIWDVGRPRPSHVELTGRVSVGENSVQSSHSTHVAGTLIASGVNPNARGMASAALLRSWDFSNDTTEMAAAQLDAAPPRISNHSYLLLAGWEFGSFGCPNGQDPQWYYIGNVAVSTQEDAYFGLYEETSAGYDAIAFASPDYLIFKVAGNDRGNEPPFQPITHCQWNGTLNGGDGGLETSNIVIPKDGGATGFDTLCGGCGAKNVITVGAVDDIPGGYAGPSSVVMSSFSGWGPADDGRIKPDLVANGINVFSSSSSSNTSYILGSGTSAAAPNASGSAALLRQHAGNLGQAWRAATYKALILHTADEAGAHPGPDYVFGWGLMNTRSAARLMTDQQATGDRIYQSALPDGGSETYEFLSDGTVPLKVTLVWTDPAGEAVPPTTLDSPDPVLVNDLDMWATAPGGGAAMLPWVLDPANPATAATTGDNDRDNVEQIYLEAPAAGVYTFTIAHEGSITSGPQAYSLIVSGNVPRIFADGFESGDTSGWSLTVP